MTFRTGLQEPGAQRQAPQAPPFLVCNGLSEKRFKDMRRGILNACRLFHEASEYSEVSQRALFVTLTYRPGVSWESGHLISYRDSFAKYVKRKTGAILRGVWKLEIQSGTGRVHYHCVWWVPKKLRWSKCYPDKKGWWPYGRVQQVPSHSPIGYLAKYVGKDAGDYGKVPARARTWAVVGFTDEEKKAWRYSMLPKWLQEFCEPEHDVRKVPERDNGSWWVNYTTKIRYRSPYEYDRFWSHAPVIRYVGWRVEDVEFLP